MVGVVQLELASDYPQMTEPSVSRSPRSVALRHRYRARHQRSVAYCNCTENLRIKLNLVQRDAIVDAKVDILAHRAHLHRQTEPQKPEAQATT